MNHGICKGCGKPIVWIRTTGGKSMPCDAQEVAYKAVKGAKGKVVTPNGEVVSCVLDGTSEGMTATPLSAKTYGDLWTAYRRPPEGES